MHTQHTDIEFDGIDLRVEYDYQPEEPQTREDPGCAAYLEICSIVPLYAGKPVMWPGTTSPLDIGGIIAEIAGDLERVEEKVWEARDRDADDAEAEAAEAAHYDRMAEDLGYDPL